MIEEFATLHYPNYFAHAWFECIYLNMDVGSSIFVRAKSHNDVACGHDEYFIERPARKTDVHLRPSITLLYAYAYLLVNAHAYFSYTSLTLIRRVAVGNCSFLP